MHWIQLWPLFVYMTTGCPSAIENILPLFRFSEFHSNNFLPHKDHQHYSQKIHEGRSLDIFDVLNPVVASVCPHDHWLSFRIENICPLFRFSEFRPNMFIPQKDHHQLVSEFHEGGSLDLFDALNPAVASVCRYDHWLWLRYRKHSPGSDFQNSAEQTSPLVDTSTLVQNSVEGYIWTSLMRRIQLLSPFVHSIAGSWTTSQNVSNFWGWKIPLDIFFPHPTTFN